MLRFAIVLLSSFFLSACDSNTNPKDLVITPDPAPDKRSLMGNGQLGVIKGALVFVKDDGGVELATSVTDSEGNYGPVMLSSWVTSPLLIEISPATDGSSVFVCDFAPGCPDPNDTAKTIAFGADVPFTATLSAVTSELKDVNTANLNPLTTAVRMRAEALGGLTTANILTAEAELTHELFRLFDVTVEGEIASLPNVNLTDVDTSITDSKIGAGVNLSIVNAGLISLIETDGELKSIDDVITSLTTKFADDGTFSDTENSGVSTAKLLSATQQQITALIETQQDTVEALSILAPEIDLVRTKNQLNLTLNNIALPTISGSAATSLLEEASYSFTPSASNPQTGELTFSVENLPSWIIFDEDTGTLSGTPDDADIGTSAAIKLSVANDFLTASLPTFTITVESVNDAPVGLPSITGDAIEDQTLTTITTEISDADGIGSISYQWLRDGQPIKGANLVNYSPEDADVDSTISVTVSYSDLQGTNESITSLDTATIVNVNDLPTGAPVVIGIIKEDQSLDIDTSSISDNEGLGVFSYQWQRSGQNIVDATSSTLLLGDTDVGKGISVTISYVDSRGSAESIMSAVSAPVINVNDPLVGVVAISGTPTEDQQLSADTNGISDADGLGIFSYQWLRDDVNVDGANTSTYFLGDQDVAKTLSLVVSYLDANGTAESTTSAASAAITSVNDTPVGSPSISGDAIEDQTLTAITTEISDADGIGTFSYQWLRADQPIIGATSPDYSPEDDDVDSTISVTVSYLDLQGTNESITSSATPTIASINDLPTGAPVILGIPQEDQLLDIDTSSIQDNEGLGVFSFQWQRSGQDIENASNATLMLGDADVDQVISINIRYVDGRGTTESLTSVPSTPVININDPLVGLVTISGDPKEDQALSAITTGVSDADGLGAFSYQWWRDEVIIAGANSNTYTPGDQDVGKRLKVEASYTDANGTAESTTSAASAAIENINDSPTGTITIAGALTEDETITANTSALADNDGLGTLSYQWRRNGINITDATLQTLLLGDTDVDAVISVDVSFTDGHGTEEFLSSVAKSAVSNVNDTPVISNPPANLLIFVDQVFDHTPTITDADLMTSAGEQLEITLVKPSPPGWIMMSPEDGRIMGKPKLTDVGLVPVQILVKDDDDATDILSFTLDIRDAQTVTFSWLRPVTRVNGDAISAEELAHYEVTYRKVGGDGTVVNVAKTETSFTSPKLLPGTYEFSIKVIDFWGLNSATTEPVKAEVN